MSRGTIRILNHDSDVLKDNPLSDPHSRRLPVYLPAEYSDVDDRHFPVIWILAPFTSWGERFFNLQAWDENIVQIMDRLCEHGEAEPVILAFPDCFTHYGGSQYVNSPVVGQYEDYLINELIPFVDSQLKTLSDSVHRGILGYSSGGFAALRLGMLYPDVFSAVVSHSGDLGFDTIFCGEIASTIRTLEQLGSIKAFLETIGQPGEKGRDWFATLNMCAMSACYSPNPESSNGFDLPFDLYTGEWIPEVFERWLAFDPLTTVSKHLGALRALRCLYFECGSRDEYSLHLGARRLHRILENESVEHQYVEFNGSHRNINWRYASTLPIITSAVSP